MTLLVSWLAAVAVPAAGLVRVRSAARAAGRTSRSLDAAAAVLAMLACGFAGVGVYLWLLFAAGARLAGAPPAAWGAAAGGGIFATRASLAAAAHLFRWATRRPAERVAPAAGLRRLTVEAVGLAGCLAAAAWAVGRLPVAEPPLLLAAPFAVALVTGFDFVVRPWLLFLGPRRSRLPERLRALEQWIGAAAAAEGLGRVRVEVLAGSVVNAFAVGVRPLGCWIVLGEGLVERMDDRALRAVAAHELAHVVRRDTSRLAAVAVLAGTLFALLMPAVFALLDRGALLPAAGVAAAGGALLMGILPGAVSRRVEFGADRLAARLLGEPDALCEALVRLAALKRDAPEREHLTHPSALRRIEALRAARA